MAAEFIDHPDFACANQALQATGSGATGLSVDRSAVPSRPIAGA